MSNVRRIHVVSFAPAYDGAAVGGHEWAHTWGEARQALLDLTENDDPNETSLADFRLITLELPASMTDDEITRFLGGRGAEVIDPPDPREDLAAALSDWTDRDDTTL